MFFSSSVVMTVSKLSEFPEFLKWPILGPWKTVQLNGSHYTITVEQGPERDCEVNPIDVSQTIHSDFSGFTLSGVYLRDEAGKQCGPCLEHNNAILDLRQHGKWLAVCSATLYDKSTTYSIFDLDAFLCDPQCDWSCIVVSVSHGWFKEVDALAGIQLDMESEIITWQDSNVISFTDHLTGDFVVESQRTHFVEQLM